MRNQIVRFIKKFTGTAFHLLLRLCHSPLLLGWMIAGTVIALITDGFSGVVSTLVNLFLVGMYAVIIKLMTENKEAPKAPIKRPASETVLGISFFLISIFNSFQFFQLIKIPAISGFYNAFFTQLYTNVNLLANAGFPQWSLSFISNALSSTVLQLVPILIIFILLGYNLRGMSLRPRFWKLSLTLLGISILMGLPVSSLHESPLYQTAAIYLIHLFINGVPEELFYRGFLLPRFEAVMHHPINALVVTSILFNAAHIPFSISHGSSIPMVILDVFSMSYPSGLIWGYLYLRTRSVVPGMLWHTANGTLGGFLVYLG